MKELPPEATAPAPEIIPPSFDSLTLAAVAEEIRADIGARFAGVRQPAPQVITLSLRGGGRARHLLLSIHPESARAHFARPPEATERLAPFGLLLRRRLVDATLAAVEQPPFDRVLRLAFDALEGRLILNAEIMGRHSNLILADARVILGAFKVVTEQMSPHRPVLPGRPYLPVPAGRPSPGTVDEEALRGLLAGDRSLWQVLTAGLLGVSPVIAREVAVRAGVDPVSPAPAALPAARRIHTVLRELADTVRRGAWAPTLYEDGGRIVAFSPVPFQIYAHLQVGPATSMSEAVDRYYREARGSSPLEERKRVLTSAVRTVLRQRESALESARQALDDAREANRFRVQGELILAYQNRVRPGDPTVTVPDYTTGRGETVIPLDPTLTAVENAQRLFRRYQKARATVRALPARITELVADTEALREALVQIEVATSADDLWEIHADLATRGLVRRAPRTRPVSASGPRRFQTASGDVILVGRSARENDHVTFHMARPDDLWFHARGVPGAHVILKIRTARKPETASLHAAAQAAAYFSEGRQAGQVAVDYVPRKHVRKPKGGRPGAVVYEGERTVLVAPHLPFLSP